ncbi:hypothetical protein ACFO3J_32330 [Streptomyces polygonati]|uniref:Secreted protein n=1 Tax=Streptomyces polygonati TaxID=1617087 RepID=A0ABV8I0V4_9ACTN
MSKLRLTAAASAAALAAILIPGATSAVAVARPAASDCWYSTDFDLVGGQVSLYDFKTCNGVVQPAYGVIEKVDANGTVLPVAYGFGTIRYTCQGSTPTVYRFAGDLNPLVTFTPGTVPCG